MKLAAGRSVIHQHQPPLRHSCLLAQPPPPSQPLNNAQLESTCYSKLPHLQHSHAFLTLPDGGNRDAITSLIPHNGVNSESLLTYPLKMESTTTTQFATTHMTQSHMVCLPACLHNYSTHCYYFVPRSRYILLASHPLSRHCNLTPACRHPVHPARCAVHNSDPTRNTAPSRARQSQRSLAGKCSIASWMTVP